MNELKENTQIEIPSVEQTREIGLPRMPETGSFSDAHIPETNALFDEVFKQTGLLEDVQQHNLQPSEASQEHETENAYGEQLEKGEDGRYYDKETGKAYDSVEAWRAEQETLAKRYESTADYYEEKAAKEWALFKNSEENGETDGEKWEHYRKSQEYYAKAKECREKAQHIRQTLDNGSEQENKDISFTGRNNELHPRLTTVPEELTDGSQRRSIAFTGNSNATFNNSETGESKYDNKTEAEKISFDLPEFERSREYMDILNERYENADPLVRNVYDRYASKLRVQDALFPDSQVAFYLPAKFGIGRGIYFNAAEDLNDPRGAGKTYFHEMGHMVDDISRPLGGWTSCTRQFKNALEKDGQNVLELYKAMTPEQKKAMDIRLFSHDACSVSDLLDGITNGQISGLYAHDRDYWKDPDKIPVEAFAHFFEASMGSPERLKLLAGFFPESYTVFQKMIDKLQPEHTVNT